MGPLSNKLLVVPPAVVVVLGVVLLVTERVASGVAVLALAVLTAVLSYLVLLARRGLAAQRRLVSRVQRQQATNERSVRRATRAARSAATSARRAVGGVKAARQETRSQLSRVEKLMLSQQDEVSSALSTMARWAQAQADGTGNGQVTTLASSLDSLSKHVHSSSEESRRQLFAIQRHLRALEEGEHGGSLRRNLDADVAALIAINRHVDARTSLPVPSKWALSPQVLELVLRLVREHPSVDTVVELGSGVSTPWIAHALSVRGEGRLVSLEHDPRFGGLTWAAVEAAGVTDLVDLRVAPLVDVEVSGERFPWYDNTRDLDSVDLVLVDGPPGATGPAARFPAFPMLRDGLRDGAFVILDDASRDDEKAILDRWFAMETDEVRLEMVDMVDRAALLRVSRAS